MKKLICDNCGKENPKHLCKRCMVNIYCSLECKKEDLEIHNNCCKYYKY